jgi:hypothetical protein
MVPYAPRWHSQTISVASRQKASPAPTPAETRSSAAGLSRSHLLQARPSDNRKSKAKKWGREIRGEEDEGAKIKKKMN